MITVNTASLSQIVVGGMLRAHFPPARAARLGVAWNEPKGGFFLSLRVPFLADNAALSRSADRYGVIWTPMSYFYPGGGGERTIRLAFSYLTPAEITDGVARLAEFVEAEAAADSTVPLP
ncbi:hypothetical protein [Nocardia arthritidis]|uniref:Aminotransferase class I/II-fold pyridoxal phosphate-dependent enzyme n=1 Tax=Nocardia arthritidis TaxID=228602 RepID=A0A6G9YHZ5_9NOCA|nr:hypothetical protein [Nocardia arthritidis]QIS12780.1 hypothetical protein F5544_24625 [Nocardia arthritidis]